MGPSGHHGTRKATTAFAGGFRADDGSVDNIVVELPSKTCAAGQSRGVLLFMPRIILVNR